MEEIKIRYVWKHTETGKITFFLFTLDEIEEFPSQSELLYVAVGGDRGKIKGWELVSRDRKTGTKAKNGVDVYERDILDNLIIIASEVVYEMGRFKLKNSELNLRDRNFDIIGNMHQHPELLKQEINA